MGVVSTKLRDSARGQQCTLRIPGICNGNPETTVLAHIRDDSKGMGNKASDFSAAFACSDCHDHFDQFRLSRPDWHRYALKGMQRTQAIWFEMGLMGVSETVAKPKKLSKVLARRHILTGEVIS